ncbi:hypothetical protein, partial [Bacillus cereus group sp. Bc238]|uniref:hypothetical protein n=1 Tax=Bacillus cereus group sp. Bc238 TaxID=3018107 RepID=UPI003F69BBF0
ADKLGLAPESDRAVALMEALETQMHQGRMDMTATFDALTHYAKTLGAQALSADTSAHSQKEALLALTTQPDGFAAWLADWENAQQASRKSE